MECFIKKIFLGKADEEAHRQFVRFGKGTYGGRAALVLQKKDKIKLSGSFEYANDFVKLVAELAPEETNFSGLVLSKEEISGLNGKKKQGLFEHDFSGNSSDVKNIAEKAYAMLLDADSNGISLKIKKKLPKPGKSGDLKIDDKFCILEADLKYLPQIKDAFLWDVAECKKARATHSYIIESIVLPAGEKDPEKMRILAKRKGRIIRKITADKNETQKEAEIEV